MTTRMETFWFLPASFQHWESYKGGSINTIGISDTKTLLESLLTLIICGHMHDCAVDSVDSIEDREENLILSAWS